MKCEILPFLYTLTQMLILSNYKLFVARKK